MMHHDVEVKVHDRLNGILKPLHTRLPKIKNPCNHRMS
jgi:hypothetical protein